MMFLLLLAALSWPALAQQDQSQAPGAQSPAESQPAPAQPSSPAGAQQAPATGTPPPSAKRAKKKSSKRHPRKKKTSLRRTKKARPSKPADSAAADPGPRRIVIRRGGTSDRGGQLEPGTPNSDADHQRQATEKMLEGTETKLKQVTQRKLSAEQQGMVRQITLYIEQSRSANKEGDLGSARNLALKAQMLCDALARQ